MKIRQAYRVLLVLTIVMAISAAFTAVAQDELLANPGFEPPFDPVEGVVPGQIAQGWSPWFSADDGALQPEYYPASDTVSGMGSPRIHGGADAQQYFTFFSGHVAGVYQQVTGVAAGNQLQFSIFAWVWSTSQESPDQSDPDADVTVEVGIDPAGGTDATSPSIVWSEPSTSFDEYTQLSVNATAQSDTATVFVRSTVNQVLMNNVVYLDDASLTVVGQAEVTAEATVEVEVTEVATSEVIDEPTDVVAEVTEVVPVVTDEATEEPTIAVEPIATIEVPEVATEEPTDEATLEATEEPTIEVTLEVTEEPTEEATAVVTAEVTDEPTAEVTDEPTVEVTVEATVEEPTAVPPTETQVPTLPIETPTLLPTEVPPTVVPPTSTPLPTLNLTMFPLSFTYIVQNGDIVADLALRYGTTVDAIIIANGLNPEAFIVVNQVLIIPVQTLPQPTVPATSIPTVEVQQVLPTPTQVVPTVPSIVIPTLVPPTLPPPPTSDAAAQSVSPAASTFYVVQYGDTLSSIAWRFRLTTRDLARANGIVNPNLVYVGQVLIIPAGAVTPTPLPPTLVPPTRVPPTLVPPTRIPPTQVPVTRTYRVLPGDTLYLISIRFNVRISDLIRINQIIDANRIFVGQVLYLP